jgi:hypothetical protein
MFGDRPSRRKDDEIDVRRARFAGRAVSTVKIDGSGWSNRIAPTGETAALLAIAAWVVDIHIVSNEMHFNNATAP